MIYKYYHKLVLLLATTSLGLAYIAEYVFHLTPCPLCIYQRFPYLLLFAISIFSICKSDDFSKDPKEERRVFWFYLLVYIASIIISFYHSGVERGVFEMSSICNSASDIKNNLIGNSLSIEDFHKLLEKQVVVSCDKPALVLLSLSMAEWNLALNIGLLGSSIFLLIVRRRMFSNQNNKRFFD